MIWSGGVHSPIAAILLQKLFAPCVFLATVSQIIDLPEQKGNIARKYQMIYGFAHNL